MKVDQRWHSLMSIKAECSFVHTLMVNYNTEFNDVILCCVSMIYFNLFTKTFQPKCLTISIFTLEHDSLVQQSEFENNSEAEFSINQLAATVAIRSLPSSASAHKSPDVRGQGGCWMMSNSGVRQRSERCERCVNLGVHFSCLGFTQPKHSHALYIISMP